MATSAAKLAANQRNATKSTGPRTLAGKAVSALNATRHAVLSVVPVLPLVETPKEWTAHRDATIASLAPVGYFETVLADRVALLLWRLRRVTRYETENTASQLETAEEDLAQNTREAARLAALFPPRHAGEEEAGTDMTYTSAVPRLIREDVWWYRCIGKQLRAVRDAGEEDPISGEDADAVIYEVADYVGVDEDEVDLPFLPEGALVMEWGRWTGWTKRLVLQAVDVVVGASKTVKDRSFGPAAYLQAVLSRAEMNIGKAERALKVVTAKLQQCVRGRLLLPEETLEKVARYEAHLERSLYKALHELQRLQAARTGSGVAPMALDVDVSVGPREDHRETFETTGEAVEP